MPALTSKSQLNIDVQAWLKDWRPNPSASKASHSSEVGHFSKTDGRIVPYSRESLLDYEELPLETDLNGSDYSLFREQMNDSTGWSCLEPYRSCNIDVRKYDIVTGRNTLVNLGTALYDFQNSFALNATTFGVGHNNPVFLSTHREEEFCLDSNTTYRQYYGFRFEALSTKCKNVDVSSNFYSIMKREIGKRRVLFVAEIDCKVPGTLKDHQPPTKSYVELKCRLKCKDNSTSSMEWLMNKYMKYWLQSYIASVPTIIEGVRDEHGNLLRIEKLKTAQIPYKCKEYREEADQGWNSQKILDFIPFVLDCISDACKRNPRAVIRVKYDASERKITAHLIEDGSFAEMNRTALDRLVSHLQRTSQKKSKKVGRNEESKKKTKRKEKKSTTIRPNGKSKKIENNEESRSSQKPKKTGNNGESLKIKNDNRPANRKNPKKIEKSEGSCSSQENPNKNKNKTKAKTIEHNEETPRSQIKAKIIENDRESMTLEKDGETPSIKKKAKRPKNKSKPPKIENDEGSRGSKKKSKKNGSKSKTSKIESNVEICSSQKCSEKSAGNSETMKTESIEESFDFSDRTEEV